MKSIRVGGALGYWGDRTDALFDLLEGGPLDYVMMDYLAEVTMSILQKQRLKDARRGYAHDFVPLMARALPLLRKKGVRLVANAGGLNPAECAEALLKAAADAGIADLRIGVVRGDDLMPRMSELSGVKFSHFETGAAAPDGGPRLLSANAYLGAFPIAEALERGAEIVITGRVNDAALALGPMIHEFGWKPSDHDLLARGTIAGHLLECGGQASGGNFNGGWRDVPGLDRLAYPIAEMREDGDVVLTIHPGQGGLVTPAVVKEQLLYEIGDPSAYVVADVVCDITQASLEDLGQNRVRVSGVRGKAPPSGYKVSMSYEGGWKVVAGLVFTWPDCVEKARAASELFLARLKKLGLSHRRHLVSILGHDGVHGAMSRKATDPDEVYLRMAFLVDDEQTAERIARETVTHVVAGIPTACGLDGRAVPQKQVVYWPSQVSKELVQPSVSILAQGGHR
ncbi:MAG TPA: acyclic terpene utilization AtuA family protein [Bdellovibrionota bacterium]|nr:acyclic terpene utilization AtuA family protein [Bdellovibrionota bacterium]